MTLRRRSFLAGGISAALVQSSRADTLPGAKNSEPLSTDRLLKWDAQDGRSRSLLLPPGVFSLKGVFSTDGACLFADAGKVVIRGAGSSQTKLIIPPHSDKNGMVFQNLAGLSLEGIEIDGQKELQKAGSAVIVRNCDDVEIRDVRIVRPHGNGILIDGNCSRVVVDQWRVEGARTNTGRENPSSGHAVALSASKAGNVKHFAVTNGSAVNCDGSGVNVSHADSGIVSNISVTHDLASNVHNTGYAGVRCTNGASNVRVSDIKVDGLSRGLMISKSTSVTVQRYECANLQAEGVLIQGTVSESSNHSLNDIKVSKSGRSNRPGSTTGILLKDCSNVLIDQATVSDPTGLMEYGIEERGICRGNRISHATVSGARKANFKLTPGSATVTP